MRFRPGRRVSKPQASAVLAALTFVAMAASTLPARANPAVLNCDKSYVEFDAQSGYACFAGECYHDGKSNGGFSVEFVKFTDTAVEFGYGDGPDSHEDYAYLWVLDRASGTLTRHQRFFDADVSWSCNATAIGTGQGIAMR